MGMFKRTYRDALCERLTGLERNRLRHTETEIERESE